MVSAFDERLGALPVTYRQACEEPIEGLADRFRSAASSQLIAVGSGGSLITARFLARLVERHHGSISRAMTPLELATEVEIVHGKHVWLLSAEGSNPDIIGALDFAASAEPASLTILCNSRDSELAKAAAEHGACVFVFPTRGQKDGFLATHTLLLSSTLLLRAATHVAGQPDPTTSPLMVDGEPIESWIAAASNRLRKVVERETLILAYDPLVAEAAWLIETNMWEAALGNVQVTDLRNFAHGRHYWLAKRADRTGLLALTTSSTQTIWAEIDRALPAKVCRSSVNFSVSDSTSIAALWAAMEITRLVGIASDIDPGRPGIPEFGRSIFTASGLLTVPRVSEAIIPALRKRGAIQGAGLPAPALQVLLQQETNFRNDLAATQFGGLVLDYDGAVVETSERTAPPRLPVIESLSRILEAGTPLAIATGRGDSVGDDLRAVLPQKLWDGVLVGYYNGAICLPLAKALQKESVPVDAGLHELVSEILRDAQLAGFVANVKDQRAQVSLTPSSGVSLTALRTAVVETATRLGLSGHRVLNSSHSVDILAPGISKLRVLDFVRQHMPKKVAPLLCIGDSGAWPGNDYDLLSSPHALSVDQVSTRLDTCWNLLPAGRPGPRGLVRYLEAAELSADGRFNFRLGRTKLN